MLAKLIPQLEQRRNGPLHEFQRVISKVIKSSSQHVGYTVHNLDPEHPFEVELGPDIEAVSARESSSPCRLLTPSFHVAFIAPSRLNS